MTNTFSLGDLRKGSGDCQGIRLCDQRAGILVPLLPSPSSHTHTSKGEEKDWRSNQLPVADDFTNQSCLFNKAPIITQKDGIWRASGLRMPGDSGRRARLERAGMHKPFFPTLPRHLFHLAVSQLHPFIISQ